MIKIGILSYGMSGKIFHAPFVFSHPLFQLFAVCERNTKQAHLDYPHIKSYDNVSDLLEDAAIDLVVVNTPNDTHYDYGMRALKAGKHILVEKPFTLNAEEAKALFDEGRKRGKYVFVYQNRRYDRDFATVKQVLESGKLGTIHEVHLRFDRYKEGISPKKFKEEPVPGAGIIYDLGPHMLDQAINLFGAPKSYEVHKSYLRSGTQVEDFAVICLQYQQPLHVFITLSLQTMGVQPAYVLHGNQGSLYKYRTDVQERQLMEGMKPTDENFAVEPEDQLAVLTARHPALIENIEVSVPSPECSYMDLYDAIAQSIISEKPFPVKEEDVILQLEIINSL